MNDIALAMGQMVIGYCELYYYDGDNYVLTDAPEDTVVEILNMEVPEDEGSQYFIDQFNERGYIARWMDVMITGRG